MRSIHCQFPARRFMFIGVAFLLIGINQPNFLPAGLALLTIAAAAHWRHRQQRRQLPAQQCNGPGE